MKLVRPAIALSMFFAGANLACAADPMIDQKTFDARWTGLYAGVVGGGHWGELTDDNCVGDCGDDPEYTAWGVGIQFGYDYQFENNVVLGGYVNVPVGANNDSFDIFNGLVKFTYKPEFAAFVGGRVGYALPNGLLPYVAGGYTFTKIKAKDVEFGATVQTVENTHHGYHLAAGVEYLLTENVSADFRYTYTEISKEAYGTSKWGEKGDSWTIALNYRF